jgi:nucleotide-binding universal stress UspA family protein
MPDKLNLLIPLDFLPESESALEYAAAIGQNLDARLHMLHILEEESPLYRIVISDKQREMIRLGASEKLDELAEKFLVPANLSYTRTVMQGKIYDKIIEASQKTRARLIIMGRTDSSDMKKNITGTNTMHIIKQAKVPVITMRKKQEHPACSHIILPLDLTKQTIIKASNAIGMARMLRARITVVSLLQDDRKGIEIKFIQRLDEIRNIFEKLEVPCGVKLVPAGEDNFYTRLNRAVAELKGDLVMIMTQQEMNFTEFFIGSRAQEIINRSDYPVLSINPKSGEKYGIPDPMSNTFINPIQILDR